MCDLLTRAASRREHHSAWFEEIREIEKLRDLGISAFVNSADVKFDVEGSSRLTKYVWNWPDDPWKLRIQTEEVAANFEGLATATYNLRHKLSGLISDYPG